MPYLQFLPGPQVQTGRDKPTWRSPPANLPDAKLRRCTQLQMILESFYDSYAPHTSNVNMRNMISCGVGLEGLAGLGILVSGANWHNMGHGKHPP